MIKEAATIDNYSDKPIRFKGKLCDELKPGE